MMQSDKPSAAKILEEALWRIYHRPERPLLWVNGGNLPWDDPAFSERMLREHLDETHGAASRQPAEREMQVAWMWQKLNLQPGQHLLDFTCGPGLYATAFAGRGCQVTGYDFSPAAIAYAKHLATNQGVAGRCAFIQQDVRQATLPPDSFDAALFIYGQLGVFPREEAAQLLARIAQSLKPGGRLCVELLDQERVDKKNSSWWFTDESGLWGDRPFLHLGERFWIEEEQISVDRFQIVHLETGTLDEVILCDQTYSKSEMTGMMKTAGFSNVRFYHAWDGLPLYDGEEWVVYVAER